MKIGIFVSFVNELISILILIITTSNLTEYWFYKIGITHNNVILYMFDTREYMLYSFVLMSWSSAISGAIGFMTQFTGMKSDYDNFVDYWKDVVFEDDVEKLELTKDLKITNYFLQRGNMKFEFEDKSLQISLEIGKKFLVLGPTGHGKSTFVDGILGKNTSMNFNIGMPRNYYHNTADMFQSIREKMPSSKLTIRDWFKCEKDNDFIMRILLITFEEEAIKNILKKFELRGKGKHPLDVEILEEISGGQKTALCLATRCYEIEKFNKKYWFSMNQSKVLEEKHQKY
jgi:hypothetical protein